MGRGVNLVKYRVRTVSFDITDDELSQILYEEASKELAVDRFELHSMHLIDGRGMVLIFWKNFRT